MGNKSSSRALRLGISQDWDADWYAEPRIFAQTLCEDVKIREFIEKKMKAAGIARITISRFRDCVELKINCLKPSVIVGRKGSEVDSISKSISTMISKEVRLKVFDIKKPELNATCIAKDVAFELQKKGVACRRVIKRYVQNCRRNGALGIRIECSGRLAGAEIARREWFQEGAVPRQKFRADIDYSSQKSYASWGMCGVKVWIYKGDVIGKNSKKILVTNVGPAPRRMNNA
jgi:small subunit ribosomal protein S3